MAARKKSARRKTRTTNAQKKSTRRSPARKGTRSTARRASTREKPAANPVEEVNKLVGQLAPGLGSQAPATPVSVALMEAGSLNAAAQAVRKKLENMPGFDRLHLERIPMLMEALGDAEKEWQRLRHGKKAGPQGPMRREAENLRRALLASARYMFRRDEEALKELENIAEGEGLPDLVNDLRKLATFAEKRWDKFMSDSRVPGDALDRIRQLADQLASLDEDDVMKQAYETRNKLYTLLSESMEEIRAAGQSMFVDMPKRLLPFMGGGRKR